MNIKNAYLCPDCDEIFCIEVHSPICPICSCKNAINLARILNRKEEPRIAKPEGIGEGKFGRLDPPALLEFPVERRKEDDKTYFDYSSVHGVGVPDNKLVVNDPSTVNSNATASTRPLTGRCDQSRDRGSGREDSECSADVVVSDRRVSRATSLTDAFRELFQCTSSVQ